MSDKPLNIAIVGLGFGAEFIPIYQRYPGVNLAAICQRTESKLNEVGDQFGIAKRYTDYDALLADPDIDAVHINTPIPRLSKINTETPRQLHPSPFPIVSQQLTLASQFVADSLL